MVMLWLCIESDMHVRAVSLIQARERPKAEGRDLKQGEVSSQAR